MGKVKELLLNDYETNWASSAEGIVPKEYSDEEIENAFQLFTDIEQIQTHPTVVPVKNLMITEAVRGNGAIMINRDGNRFCTEMATRDVMSAAILEQTGGTAYLMFDTSIRKSLKAIETYAEQGARR